MGAAARKARARVMALVAVPRTEILRAKAQARPMGRRRQIRVAPLSVRAPALQITTARPFLERMGAAAITAPVEAIVRAPHTAQTAPTAIPILIATRTLKEALRRPHRRKEQARVARKTALLEKASGWGEAEGFLKALDCLEDKIGQNKKVRARAYLKAIHEGRRRATVKAHQRVSRPHKADLRA